MTTLSTTTSLLMHSLSWALLYSLGQGMLIYVLLYILLKAMPDLNARVKYYLSFSAFGAICLWFADTWVSQYQKLKGITVYITQASTENAMHITYPVRVAAAGQAQDTLHHYLPRIEHYFPLLMVIYSLGLMFMLCRFVIDLVQLRRLRSNGLIEAGNEWDVFLSYWQKQFGIARPVQLFLSKRVNVPVMLGTLKPIILLPIATMNHLTTEQLEAILLHELAHIRRHDHLLNILQTIAETILFFNPFIWLTAAIIRREREHCCDDLVVACSSSPLSYAKALAILEQDRIETHGLALAATGQKNQLFNRIKRIMEMKKSTINYSQLTIILVAIIAITCSVAVFSPSFAQKAKSDKEKEKKTTTTSRTTYASKTITTDSNGRQKIVTHSSCEPQDKVREEDDKVEVHLSVTDDDDDRKGSGANANISITTSSDDNFDLEALMREIERATKEAGKAIATVDVRRIHQDIAAARHDIEAVDWDEISATVSKALAEVDKELSSEKMRDINIQIKKELEHSREALEDAKESLRQEHRAVAVVKTGRHEGSIESDSDDIETMLKKMEHDGLIDRSEKFKIEKEHGQLFINGEQQSSEVYNKYKRYLDGRHVEIKGRRDNLNVNINN